jgi:hypothetical protein
MQKISLSDNSGRWFDAQHAKQWPEAIVLADDGTAISRATGKSWEHETLFLTQAGTFVMNLLDTRTFHSQYVECSVELAAKWLIANGYTDELARLELGHIEKRSEI